MDSLFHSSPCLTVSSGNLSYYTLLYVEDDISYELPSKGKTCTLKHGYTQNIVLNIKS